MLRAVAAKLKAAASATGGFLGFTDASGNRLPVPYTILQSGIGMGIPSSGVIGANGALTLTTALHMTYSQGCYMYFPANAIGAGIAAGLYWVVMSSATVGTIYNNTYTGGKPAYVTAPTVFAAAGSAYTQDLTEITLSSVVIPGGTLGADGQLRSTVVWVISNTATSRTLRQRFGGAAIYGINTSSVAALRLESNVVNNGVALQKIANGTSAFLPAINAVTAPSTAAINTAADVTNAFTGALQIATDWIFLEYIRTEVFPS